MKASDVKSEQSDCGASRASTSSPCSSVALSDDSPEKTSSYPFLGTPEDTFIQNGLNLTTVAELSKAVEKCKDMVLGTTEYSEERKWLVRYLIELRLRLEEARDAEAEQRKLEPIGAPDVSSEMGHTSFNEGEITKTRDKRIILGHHFTLQAPVRSVLKCDRCCRGIWGVLHLWYECADCQYKCHMKCLQKIKRQCTYVRVCETPFYSNDICPEAGLAAQGYRCHECKTLLAHKSGWCEPRQCDYDGRYYCSKCHWDASSVSPARVVHNWDFTERKVCCSCYSFLRLMLHRPVINLDILNPQLFQFVLDLAAVKKLRSQILLIKQYLITCPQGLKEKNKKKLIWSMNLHLIEKPSGLFSLQNLIEIHRNIMLPVLKETALICTEHIRKCQTCKRKGYYCELCPPRKADDDHEHSTQEKREKLLFPFDDPLLVFVCGECSAVFHRECWMKRSMTSCRRCERLQERRSLLQEGLG